MFDWLLVPCKFELKLEASDAFGVDVDNIISSSYDKKFIDLDPQYAGRLAEWLVSVGLILTGIGSPYSKD